MHGRRTGRGPRIRPHNHTTIVLNRHDGCLATQNKPVSRVAFAQTRRGNGPRGAGGRTPMSTGCLRKSRVVSRDWSRSPLSVAPDSMMLCGSMSSRSTKEAVLGGPENMVCARRALRFGTELGASVAGFGLVCWFHGQRLASAAEAASSAASQCGVNSQKMRRSIFTYKSAVGHAPASHCTEPSWLYPVLGNCGTNARTY